MVSWYSASQGHQQRPWHVSPQPLHQARLHPYQQKPHSQQCNHVIQHYGLWKRRPIITVQDLNSHAGKKKKKKLVLLQFAVWITTLKKREIGWWEAYFPLFFTHTTLGRETGGEWELIFKIQLEYDHVSICIPTRKKIRETSHFISLNKQEKGNKKTTIQVMDQLKKTNHPWHEGRVISKENIAFHLPTVTLSPMIVGNTFPLILDLATWTRELSWMLVPDPTLMLFTSPV